ncbi:MAG: hypothetical protein HRT57_14775 [Crocinitomicaceae bacterium]|nr:hypothetical protein [Crocinitomicaceae bacterium]
MKSLLGSKLRLELILVWALFIFLWIYLIIRANSVFFTYDEILTKWNYMIPWNYIPREGLIDANNHFINTFLGGLFIRLFNSDDLWIVRLPNLLAFPVYFWSIYGLRHFFNKKINFYGLLITLIGTAFVIEYFALARGYGISMAFLALALQQTFMYVKHVKKKYLIVALLAWIVAIFSNLTLIPIFLFAIFYFSIFIVRNTSKRWLIATLISLAPVAYLIEYSFELSSLGKLYLGSTKGFIETTIHTITPHLWGRTSFWLDLALIALTLFILISLFILAWRQKNLFKPKFIFPIFLAVGILNIFAQNILLGINFPQDRAALYLVVLFFGGLFFAIDYWKNKWGAYPIILITIAFFIKQFGFETSIIFRYEHFGQQLLTSIPEKISGNPASVGSSMDSPMAREMIRSKKLPFRSLQMANTKADTLLDYIIAKERHRPGILNLYHPIYTDKYSNYVLFKRNHFLKRVKKDEVEEHFDNDHEFNRIYKDSLKNPHYLRCSGTLENMDVSQKTMLVFTASNAESTVRFYTQNILLNKYTILNNDGSIEFDFGIVMNDYPKAELLTVFVWNVDHVQVKGEIKLEIFDFEFD